VTPSRRTFVVFAVHTILISVTPFPALIVVAIIVLVSVLVFVLFAVIRHQRWCAES
jgi:hypothetical protein